MNILSLWNFGELYQISTMAWQCSQRAVAKAYSVDITGYPEWASFHISRPCTSAYRTWCPGEWQVCCYCGWDIRH